MLKIGQRPLVGLLVEHQAFRGHRDIIGVIDSVVPGGYDLVWVRWPREAVDSIPGFPGTAYVDPYKRCHNINALEPSLVDRPPTDRSPEAIEAWLAS